MVSGRSGNYEILHFLCQHNTWRRIKMEHLPWPQNQDKVTEPNTEGAEGNLDPSLQFSYFLPWIWVQTCVCGQFRCRAVVRQELWAAQKESEPVLSIKTDWRRYPQLVPVWAACYRLISWPGWIAGGMTFALSQGTGVPEVTRGAGLGRM